MIGTFDNRRKEATIVGAGIAGMLAAYYLDQNGYRVTLLEEQKRAGGLIETKYTRLGMSESAAHSLIATRAVSELCAKLGVELEKLRQDSQAKYIVRNGRPSKFPLSGIETLKTLGRAALAPGDSNNGRQNLADWGRVHLGDKAVDYLLTPFVRGIYGAQPVELGVRAAFPSLEVPRGKSLLSAMLGRKRKSPSENVKARVAPRYGMGDLVGRLEKHLERRLGRRFRKGELVTAIPDAPNIVISTPAHAAAELFKTESPTLARELQAVAYTPMVSVTAFVERENLTRPARGVGVLMPACEQRSSLGILFNSSSYPERVLDESRFSSFTLMMGGTAAPHWLMATDEELAKAIKQELSEVLGLQCEPQELVIHRWPKALPQYSVKLPDVWDCARESWCAEKGHILFGNYTGQISLRGMIETAMRKCSD